ncbi:M23 family metallopeptidase [Actinoplanes sp. NPDC051411]|uniref:M23 family metallopeptidase n=1 Tax=Actinoplanes sp. NPDC051411 TaxID=3155522 RepID=UPI00342B2086
MGFLVGGLLLTGSGPAFAEPGGDAAARAGHAVDRAEALLENATATAQQAARRFEAASAALPAARTNLATARGLVAAALTDANTAGRQANAARAAYGIVADRFQQAQGKLDSARVRVDGIAQASYMGSEFSRINVLVDASGPQDVIDRLSLIVQVMRTQQHDVDVLTSARGTARTEQDRAALAKRTAEVAEMSAREKLRAAQAAQASAVRAKRALDQIAASRLAALRVANGQRSAVLARYQAAKDEEARIQAQLRGFSARSGSSSGRYAGGRLLMPVDGWKSSNFGYRYDPFYRVWQLHAGTDFAAPHGMPIHAAASGRVVRAGWDGGYGNYTCVDHGHFDGVDFMTCYGHQSAILVDVGEWVHRGDVIGRVGTTGASTGNHLHFETRFDGVPRNPLKYLPSCLC